MVRTWMADVTSLLEEKNYQLYYNQVPQFRKEKADKLRFQADKALSIGAWVLLTEMRKVYNLNEDVPFNLSHSGNYALCSVEDSGTQNVKVGCDIEQMKKERLNIAERFFHPKEYQYILEHSGSFYNYWVLKESFVKATRYGLKLGLNTFEIQYNSQGNSVLTKKPDNIHGEFYFKEYDVSPIPYKVAVCASEDNFAEELKIITL